MDAILQPSATIAPGYGTVIVETKAGTVFQGILKQTTDAGVQNHGCVDGKLVSDRDGPDIKEKKGSPISLMPEGQHANLSLQEFTDLIEYLTTLKQPASTLVSEHGMPADIPSLAKPVTGRPFFTQGFELPRSKVESGLTSFRQVPGFSANVFLVLHQKG